MADDGTDWEKRYRDLQSYVDRTLKPKADNWDAFTTDPVYKPALDLIEPLEKGTYRAQDTVKAEKPADNGVPEWFRPYAQTLEQARRQEKYQTWLRGVESWEKDKREKYPELGDAFFGPSGKLTQTMKRIGSDDPEEAFRLAAPPEVLARAFAPLTAKDEKPGPKTTEPLGGKPPGSEEEPPPRTFEEALERHKAKLVSSE